MFRMMNIIGLIYISGIIVNLILMLLIYSYFCNNEEHRKIVELEVFGCLIPLSWVTVVLLVCSYGKQIKEILSFKRNDNTTI